MCKFWDLEFLIFKKKIYNLVISQKIWAFSQKYLVKFSKMSKLFLISKLYIKNCTCVKFCRDLTKFEIWSFSQKFGSFPKNIWWKIQNFQNWPSFLNSTSKVILVYQILLKPDKAWNLVISPIFGPFSQINWWNFQNFHNWSSFLNSTSKIIPVYHIILKSDKVWNLVIFQKTWAFSQKYLIKFSKLVFTSEFYIKSYTCVPNFVEIKQPFRSSYRESS